MIVDTREHPEIIADNIISYFDTHDIPHISQKLDVGDYQIAGFPGVSIDRKHDLQEVASNLIQEHERFRNECIRAQESSTKLIVLVEHSNRIRSVSDVEKWINPRLRFSPKAITGERIANIMRVMQAKYGVEWLFCDKAHTGQRIVEILKERYYGS